MKKAHEIGRQGEAIALHFLACKKHNILERNWRWQKAEIDINSQDEKTLVFVEVKTRSTERYGQPKEFVSLRKEALMKEAAEAYLEINELELELRFDIISIVLKNRTPKIEHIENVF
jgi:putative endonuclease